MYDNTDNILYISVLILNILSKKSHQIVKYYFILVQQVPK